jgi:oxygen-independent coproporphyrinogen-3 oxidase
VFTVRKRETLSQLIDAGAIPPFVYCYPPRSAYRGLNPKWTVRRIWDEDLQYSPSTLNLYFHVPFCRYRCGYCNLYTVVSRDRSLYTAYVDTMCQQLEASRAILEKRLLKTVYIGGGTPILLDTRDLDKLFARLSDVCPNWRETVEEVCIEASPDSIVDPARPTLMEDLMSLGVTRINLGVQSLSNQELREAGRSVANEQVIRQAISIIKEHNLPNLSTDLLMGFHGQTDRSWQDSVSELIALKPETISTYFLTIRPDAWFSKLGRYLYSRDPGLYERYDFARMAALGAGYVQESNVRYKMPGRGGYLQKVLYFRGVPVLGIGAGARSYTGTVDYIIGGGPTPHVSQVWDYVNSRQSENIRPRAGFEYTDEERIRKRLVLDLFDLRLSELEVYGVQEHAWIYEEVLAAAVNLGLLRTVGADHYQLTSSGYKYRDILSWMFFSESVLELDSEFYIGLHRKLVEGLAPLAPPMTFDSSN